VEKEEEKEEEEEEQKKAVSAKSYCLTEMFHMPRIVNSHTMTVEFKIPVRPKNT
jgi:hypothetical protein